MSDDYCNHNDEDIFQQHSLKKPRHIYLPKSSIDILIHAKASTYQICAYIALVATRQGASCRITGSTNVVSKLLSIRPQKAKLVLNTLFLLEYDGIKLLRHINNDDEWLYEEAERICSCSIESVNVLLLSVDYLNSNDYWLLKKSKKSVKCVDYGNYSSAVFLTFQFVKSKIKSYAYPLLNLKSCGDVAARLLLLLWYYYNEGAGGYIVSEEGVCLENCASNGVNLWFGVAPEVLVTDDMIHSTSSTTQTFSKEALTALEVLRRKKLVKTAVVIKIANKGGLERFYDLHVEGDPITGSLRIKLRNLALEHRVSVGRVDGRSHDNKYNFIAPVGCTATLCRVIRPVYQMPSKDIPEYQKVHENEISQWIEVFEGRSCFPTEIDDDEYYIQPEFAPEVEHECCDDDDLIIYEED